MTALVVAAASAFVAAACALPGTERVRPRADRLRIGLRPVLVTGALVLALLVSVAPLQHVVLAAVATMAAVGGVRLLGTARARRQAEGNRVLVLDYCEALLGELRAGQPVQSALQRCVPSWPPAEAVATAAALGADVPGAMRRLAEGVPGAGALGGLAAAWWLSSGAGAGLAFSVEQVLETTRDQLALERLVQAELAAARATARLVVALPVVVLAGAQSIGARPWQFLVSTAPGTMSLALGVALALLGLTWIDRIARAAQAG